MRLSVSLVYYWNLAQRTGSDAGKESGEGFRDWKAPSLEIVGRMAPKAKAREMIIAA